MVTASSSSLAPSLLILLSEGDCQLRTCQSTPVWFLRFLFPFCVLVFVSSVNELYFSFQILINFQICFFVSYICCGWCWLYRWEGGNGNSMFAYWEKQFEFFSKTLDLTGKLFCSLNRLQSIRKLPAVKMINVPFG